jgi:hypothetical protein
MADRLTPEPAQQSCAPDRLAAFLQRAAGWRFAWGAADCGALALEWAGVVTGERPALAFAHPASYAAWRRIERGRSLADIAAETLAPAGYRVVEGRGPGRDGGPRRGDILVTSRGPGASMAIATSPARMAGLGPRGVVVMPVPASAVILRRGD